jgi:hypothetical protein
MRNQLERHFQSEKHHKHDCQLNQELTNQTFKKAQENEKLRDRKQDVSQPIHKSNIIQGEVIIYHDDVSTEHLTLLVIPKVTYSSCDKGVRLENHFLSSVMHQEQPESMSHLSSKHPSNTNMG